MNYYLYCLRRFARLILLLWIVFRIAPLAAQDRAARLDFQVRKATLDTFVRQLEDVFHSTQLVCTLKTAR